jgi:AcrR family transcriptional regulator
MANRITKDPEVRRQEIIDVARELFETQGIQKTAMNEIAEKIGVAKGLVYYYFSSKEQLVTAVVEQFIAGLEVTLTQIILNDQLDFYQKFSAFLGVYFNAIENHPAIFTYSPNDPGLFSLIKDQMSTIALALASQLLKNAVEQGLVMIEYPEYMLKILIRGLGDLYMEGIQDPAVHATLIEQTLGLTRGKLGLAVSYGDGGIDAAAVSAP